MSTGMGGMASFAQMHKITDVCVLVADVERSIRFYVDRLGFRLLHRAEGFADFKSAGITLAAWEIAHMAHHTGVSAKRASPGIHKACVAVQLETPAAVDATHAELVEAGIAFTRAPADYPWNARCCYFADPDDNLWELYAWLAGGPVGTMNPQETGQ